jgi:hypothetical protein
MAWFLVALILPWLATYPWISSWMGRCTQGWPRCWLSACLAIGFGLGLSSLAFFLGLQLGAPTGATYCAVEVAVWAVGGVFGLMALRRSARSAPCAVPAPSRGRGAKILAAVFLLALILAIAGTAGVYHRLPHGDGDAWAIWNQRARFLFRGGPEWKQAFSPVFAHPDYPLLIPAANARLWTWLGADRPWVPWLVGILFTFTTVGTLAAATSALRSRAQGLLAGLALLGSASYLAHGAHQYADVPLSFFFLAAVVLLSLFDAPRLRSLAMGDGLNALQALYGLDSAAGSSRKPLLVLAGLSAGLAAWTKNEGWLFLAVVFVVRCLSAWRRQGHRGILEELPPLAVGALPAVAITLWFKITLVTTGNDLVAGQGWTATLARLLDPSRYGLVAQAVVTHGFHLGKALAIVLPLCLLLLGRAKGCPRAATAVPALAAVLLLMGLGYGFVYVTTPVGLRWHLETSVERLLVHLFPMTIYLLFLYCATPEELDAKSF